MPWHRRTLHFNTLRPIQNGRHFADDIITCIFLNENVWIPIEFSQNFDPKDPINSIPALVQTMAWRRPGDKPLSESMMVSLMTHVCVTRPRWVNGPLVFIRGIQGTRGFPHRIKQCVALVVYLLLTWTSCWVKSWYLPVIWDAMTLMWRHSNKHIRWRDMFTVWSYQFSGLTYPTKALSTQTFQPRITCCTLCGT